MPFYRGYTGSILLNVGQPATLPVSLHGKEWSLRTFSDDVDITHALSRDDVINKGFIRVATSLKGAEGNIRAVWCSEDDPFRGPPAIIPGLTVDISLYVHTGELKRFYIRTGKIVTVDFQLMVRGLAEYGISFKADGFFSYPVHVV